MAISQWATQAGAGSVARDDGGTMKIEISDPAAQLQAMTQLQMSLMGMLVHRGILSPQDAVAVFSAASMSFDPGSTEHEFLTHLAVGFGEALPPDPRE